MQYQNLKSTEKAFKSSNYIYRDSTLSEALVAAGIIQRPHFVREAKTEGVLRDRNDTFNERPSRRRMF